MAKKQKSPEEEEEEEEEERRRTYSKVRHSLRLVKRLLTSGSVIRYFFSGTIDLLPFHLQ